MPEKLTEAEQNVAGEIETKILKALDEKQKSTIDVNAIADKIKSDLELSEKDFNDKVQVEVQKQMDELKRNHNPFTNIQNTESIKVKSQKQHSVGAWAILTLLSKKSNANVIDMLGNRLKSNPNESDIALAQTMAKQYFRANDNYNFERMKSLGVDSITSGAGFSDPSADSEFVQQLRAMSVVRQAGPVLKRLIGGKARVNKGKTSSTGYWIEGGAAITQSQPSFEQVVLTAKKLAVLTPIDNEAIRWDIHSMAQEVELEIATTIATTEDYAFLQGTGATGQPKGIINWAANSNARTSSPTADKVGKDLLKAIQELKTDNVRMVKPVWFMNPVTKLTLAAQVDANGVDKFYARTIKESNSIMNYPVYETTNMPSNTVLIVDMDAVLVGEANDLLIEASDQYGFANDQTFIRAIQSSDLNMKYYEAASTITSVDWDTVL